MQPVFLEQSADGKSRREYFRSRSLGTEIGGGPQNSTHWSEWVDPPKYAPRQVHSQDYQCRPLSPQWHYAKVGKLLWATLGCQKSHHTASYLGGTSLKEEPAPCRGASGSASPNGASFGEVPPQMGPHHKVGAARPAKCGPQVGAVGNKA